MLALAGTGLALWTVTLAVTVSPVRACQGASVTLDTGEVGVGDPERRDPPVVRLVALGERGGLIGGGDHRERARSHAGDGEGHRELLRGARGEGVDGERTEGSRARQGRPAGGPEVETDQRGPGNPAPLVPDGDGGGDRITDPRRPGRQRETGNDDVGAAGRRQCGSARVRRARTAIRSAGALAELRRQKGRS